MELYRVVTQTDSAELSLSWYVKAILTLPVDGQFPTRAVSNMLFCLLSVFSTWATCQTYGFKEFSVIGWDFFLRFVKEGIREIIPYIGRWITHMNVPSTVISALDATLTALRLPQSFDLGNLSHPPSTFLYFCRQFLLSWYNEQL